MVASDHRCFLGLRAFSIGLKFNVLLARRHHGIADIRRDALHQLTTDLLRRFEVVVIEDPSAVGMAANGRLHR